MCVDGGVIVCIVPMGCAVVVEDFGGSSCGSFGILLLLGEYVLILVLVELVFALFDGSSWLLFSASVVVALNVTLLTLVAFSLGLLPSLCLRSSSFAAFHTCSHPSAVAAVV